MTPSEIANAIIREKVEERLRFIRQVLGIATTVLWISFGFLVFMYRFDYPLSEAFCFSGCLILTTWLWMLRKKIWQARIVHHLEYEIRSELNWFF